MSFLNDVVQKVPNAAVSFTALNNAEFYTATGYIVKNNDHFEERLQDSPILFILKIKEKLKYIKDDHSKKREYINKLIQVKKELDQIIVEYV